MLIIYMAFTGLCNSMHTASWGNKKQQLASGQM